MGQKDGFKVGGQKIWHLRGGGHPIQYIKCADRNYTVTVEPRLTATPLL